MNPWGPIIAATIAGFIAFVGMIITKENKVSEFRQAWINEFREEVSSLIESYKKWAYNEVIYKNHSSTPYKYIPGSEVAKSYNEKSNWYENISLEARSEIERYKGKIKLRLNSDKSRRKEPENKLDELLDKILKTKDLALAEKLSEEIYHNTSLILTTEWRVVKKGEDSYVKSKKVILCLAVFIASTVSISFIFHFEEAMKWLMNSPTALK